MANTILQASSSSKNMKANCDATTTLAVNMFAATNQNSMNNLNDTVVNFSATDSRNKNLINHASDSINRVVSTNKSTEHKAAANSVINRTGRLKKLSAPLYVFALAIIVTIAGAFSTVEVEATPVWYHYKVLSYELTEDCCVEVTVINTVDGINNKVYLAKPTSPPYVWDQQFGEWLPNWNYTPVNGLNDFIVIESPGIAGAKILRYCPTDDEDEIILNLIVDVSSSSPPPSSGWYDFYWTGQQKVRISKEELAECRTPPPPDEPTTAVEPCIPDCPQTPFQKRDRETLKFEIGEECPDCFVIVTYTWRMACSIWQDLQILEMIFDEDGPCSRCNIEKIYESVLTGIIALSNRPAPAPNFRPRQAPDCHTQWRVANAGCWNEDRWYILQPGGVLKEVIVWRPCEYIGAPCCLQPIRVCRISPFLVDIQVNGPGTPWNGQCPDRHCVVGCDWAGSVNGTYGTPNPIPIAYPTLSKLGKNIFETEAANYTSDINAFHLDDVVNISFTAIQSGIYEINTFASSGLLIETRSFDVSEGFNTIKFNTSDYHSGAYFYTLTIQETPLFLDKFVIGR